jgi:hypothetical protein
MTMPSINRDIGLGQVHTDPTDVPEAPTSSSPALAKDNAAYPSHVDGAENDPHGGNHPQLGHGSDGGNLGINLGNNLPPTVYADVAPGTPLPPAAPPPKEDPPNPLVGSNPPDPSPGPSKVPGTLPTFERTPGGGIIGIKGKL